MQLIQDINIKLVPSNNDISQAILKNKRETINSMYVGESETHIHAQLQWSRILKLGFGNDYLGLRFSSPSLKTVRQKK